MDDVRGIGSSSSGAHAPSDTDPLAASLGSVFGLHFGEDRFGVLLIEIADHVRPDVGMEFLDDFSGVLRIEPLDQFGCLFVRRFLDQLGRELGRYERQHPVPLVLLQLQEGAQAFAQRQLFENGLELPAVLGF